MKHIIKDEHNIKNKKIHKAVTRVKMFILNNNDDFIMVSAFDGLQLPGGHVENNEDLSLAVMREVEEETGIKLTQEETPEPFCNIETYSKLANKVNSLSSIFYYFIKTDKQVDLSKRNLTEHEKANNYAIKYINKEDLEKELESIINSCPNVGSRIVADETLFAYKILNKLNKNEQEQNESLGC